MQSTSTFTKQCRSASRKALAVAILGALAAAAAYAEEEKPWSPPGLPAGIDWTFNLDATWGVFGFGNSLYKNVKSTGDDNSNLDANWMEGSIKPALSGAYTLSNSSQIYGKVSVVGERTYFASPPLVGGDASSFKEEDAYLGWRSGNTVAGGENVLDLSAGREQYKLGHGMLLWDGASEGGTNGGYWTNARKAFKFAAIARYKPGSNTFEAFYLEKDELPENDTDTKISGLNYEYAIGEDTTLGATFMKLSADTNAAPQRDGLKVYNLRAFTAPFSSLKALSFEAEYAKEDNGSKLDSYAWNALVAYQFESPWTPKLSYRYAFFEGDNPNTSKNEGFDGLLTGFYDWGTWWQGEIGGEYFLSNSNLISHQVRVHTKPIESVGTGLIYYDFRLDKPEALGSQVTSDKVARELDWYTDWTVNKNFMLSFVAAVADPGKAVEQAYGRTDTFIYGMVFAAYSF